MSARQTNTVGYVLVGKGVARTATASVSSPNDLADGEVELFTVAGAMIDNANVVADMKFRVAIGRANEVPFISEIIDGSLLTLASQVNSTIGSAAAEQIDYIGYNGSANSINAIDSNVYELAVWENEFIRSSSDGRSVKHFVYESDSTAVQSEIAIGLAGNAIMSMAKAGEKWLAPKAICNTAVDATYDLTNTSTVVNGSKVFAVASNLTYNTASGTLVVGDFVRFASTLNGTLALTDDVYKVTAINTLDVTVDRPIQVPSGAWTDAGDGIQVITAAQGAAANWGVALTGLPLKHVPGKKFFSVVSWETTMKNFGTTVSSLKSTAASQGVGVAKAVSDHEWFSRGFEGEYHRVGEPTLYGFTSAVDLATPLIYSVTNISYTDTYNVGLQSSSTASKSITIYSPTDATAATDASYMNDGTDGVWVMLQTITGLTGLDID